MRLGWIWWTGNANEWGSTLTTVQSHIMPNFWWLSSAMCINDARANIITCWRVEQQNVSAHIATTTKLFLRAIHRGRGGIEPIFGSSYELPLLWKQNSEYADFVYFTKWVDVPMRQAILSLWCNDVIQKLFVHVAKHWPYLPSDCQWACRTRSACLIRWVSHPKEWRSACDVWQSSSQGHWE